MNILHVFTRKSLRANRSRTLVTIIGIILSMALFTAVIEGAYSGQQFLIRSLEEKEGKWHAYVAGVDGAQAEEVRNLDGIRDSTVWQEVGWAEIDSVNEYKPYLLVESFDDSLTDLLAVRLVTGRMPEKEGEILLPNHLAGNGGVSYSVGDTLSLSLGRRVDQDGKELIASNAMVGERPEQLVDTWERTYTVVGIYERFDNVVESYGCPGYTALTKGGGSGSFTVFFTLKNPARAAAWLDSHLTPGYRYTHTNLLRFNGSFFNGNLSTVLYGFAAVLVFLIAFGSISLIYNSFSISVSERTKQFGILKSVGATKKQIRASVLYEALLLSGVGIPVGLIVGCAGIGITLYCLRGAFSSFLFSGSSTRMRLVLNPAALLIAVVVCLATTLISAWVPAKRAIRVSPIDSIRQTDEVKLRGKEVKTAKLTQKLFGFEGTMASKNFKRNRRRYRSTVLSLFLSVVLFISASSFCAYLTDAVGGVADSGNKADIVYNTVGEDRENPDEVLALLSGVEGVTEAVYQDVDSKEIWFPMGNIDESFWGPWTDRSVYAEGDVNCVTLLAFVQDEVFRSLCAANGIDAGPYFDSAAPMALAYNQSTTRWSDENSPVKWYSFQTLDEKKLPCTAIVREPRNIEGYVFNSYETAEDGGKFLIYHALGESDTVDWDNSMKLPAAEAEIEVEYIIGGVVEKSTFALLANTLTLFYPYSMEAAVLGPAVQPQRTSFSFKANDHAQAYEQMKTLLTDAGMDTSYLNDLAARQESVRMMVTVVNVFAYGFIILISLIAVANVFNTISTNVLLRRREFAMLRSIGLAQSGFRRMMNYECVIYGVKGLVWGLPAAILMTYVIWRITDIAYEHSFYVPWYSIAIAVGSVFVVVFATMLYATDKIRKDNPIDALKNENL